MARSVSVFLYWWLGAAGLELSQSIFIKVSVVYEVLINQVRTYGFGFQSRH